MRQNTIIFKDIQGWNKVYFVKCLTKLSNKNTTECYICLNIFGNQFHGHKQNDKIRH